MIFFASMDHPEGGAILVQLAEDRIHIASAELVEQLPKGDLVTTERYEYKYPETAEEFVQMLSDLMHGSR